MRLGLVLAVFVVSASLAPGSFFFSAARTDGAGIADARTVASAVAPNSRRVCLFFIVVSPLWES